MGMVFVVLSFVVACSVDYSWCWLGSPGCFGVHHHRVNKLGIFMFSARVEQPTRPARGFPVELVHGKKVNKEGRGRRVDVASACWSRELIQLSISRLHPNPESSPSCRSRYMYLIFVRRFPTVMVSLDSEALDIFAPTLHFRKIPPAAPSTNLAVATHSHG